MRFPKTLQDWAILVLGPFAILWIVIAGYYSTSAIYFDHAEPSVVVIAQQWMHGRPMYHTFDSPYLYSVLYGPSCFLWLAGALSIYPDPILASKLAGGLAGFMMMGLLLWTFRKSWGWQIGLAALGVAACEFLIFGENSFWDRPDPLLILASAMGLAALVIKNARVGAILMALGLALALDGKIHGGFYLLPSLAVWWRRYGGLACSAVALAGGGGSLLVFLLPGISLINYMTFLGQAMKHQISHDLFQQNIFIFAGLLLPIGIMSRNNLLYFKRRQIPEQTILFISLVVAGLLVCGPASKTGAGGWHLMPLICYAAYCFGGALAEAPPQPRLTPIFLIALILIGFGYVNALRTLDSVYQGIHQPDALLPSDLATVLKKYSPRETQMGVGSDGSYNFYSPLIYQTDTPCVVNVGAYMDMKTSGLGADALRGSLKEEKFRFWLVSEGEKPFSLLNNYDKKPLFDASIEQVFAEHYTKVDTLAHFDIYQAK